MLLIGIDEAGYGPLLGPLVVAGAAFRVGGASSPAEAGARIAVALRAADLAVGDSKRIFGPAHDLSALERPVLAFAEAPADLDELLRRVAIDRSIRGAAPWYAGRRPLPCVTTKDELAGARTRLAAALADASIEFVGSAADVVPERRLNLLFHQGNKADALFAVAAGVLDRLAGRREATEALCVVFDRQGGRAYYGPKLQNRWSEGLVMPVAESPRVSTYRLRIGCGPAEVSFEVEADGRHPQVGLASMLAKYLREVFMSLFNEHFAAICPGVTPTAGYVEDGRRWLEQTRSLRDAAGVADADLVRVR